MLILIFFPTHTLLQEETAVLVKQYAHNGADTGPPPTADNAPTAADTAATTAAHSSQETAGEEEN